MISNKLTRFGLYLYNYSLQTTTHVESLTSVIIIVVDVWQNNSLTVYSSANARSRDRCETKSIHNDPEIMNYNNNRKTQTQTQTQLLDKIKQSQLPNAIINEKICPRRIFQNKIINI